MKYNKNALYIKFVNEENKYEIIERPMHVMKQRNGVIIRCKNMRSSQGVVSQDGSTIYQFEDKPIMDPLYPVVKKITYAEYCEIKNNIEDTTISDPDIDIEGAFDIIINGKEYKF